MLRFCAGSPAGGDPLLPGSRSGWPVCSSFCRVLCFCADSPAGTASPLPASHSAWPLRSRSPCILPSKPVVPLPSSCSNASLSLPHGFSEPLSFFFTLPSTRPVFPSQYAKTGEAVFRSSGLCPPHLTGYTISHFSVYGCFRLSTFVSSLFRFLRFRPLRSVSPVCPGMAVCHTGNAGRNSVSFTASSAG